MIRTRSNKRTFFTSLTFAGVILGFATADRVEGAVPSISDAMHKSFTGTISRVDVREQTVAVESFLQTKVFATRQQCRVQLEDKPIAALDDLLPGQRVEIKYLATNGAMLATRIIQENVAFTGQITSVDEVGKVLLVKDGLEAKAFKVSDQCKFSQKHGKGQGFANLKLGHKITVRYAPTLRQNLAFKIESSSQVMTGILVALDANAGILKACSSPASKTLKFGKDCAVVIGGRSGAKIRDLRVGDKVACHYEDLGGVLVANRIALESPAISAAKPGRPIRREAMRSPDEAEAVR